MAQQVDKVLILHQADSIRLEKIIEDHLADGWVMRGDLHHSGKLFIQQMVKYR